MLYIALCGLSIVTVTLIAWWELRRNWIEKADQEWLDSIEFPIGESGTLDPPRGGNVIAPPSSGYTPLVEPAPDAFPLHYRSPYIFPGTIVAREEPQYEQPIIEYPKE